MSIEKIDNDSISNKSKWKKLKTQKDHQALIKLIKNRNTNSGLNNWDGIFEV